MPHRIALRWFSEICGICLGVGVLWNHLDNRELHRRIDGLQKSIPKTVVQNNNQSVIVESESDRIIREIAKQRGWVENGNVPATKGSTEQPRK